MVGEGHWHRIKAVMLYVFKFKLKLRQCSIQRRQWIWNHQNPRDEYSDWKRYHKYMFILTTVIVIWFNLFFVLWVKPDFPRGRDWAYREAHMEIERRRRAGLPLISPDLIERSRVEASLPSEEELRDFDIVIQARNLENEYQIYSSFMFYCLFFKLYKFAQ